MSDFLMHHGILGQKWGVRNGPPYPLKGISIKKTKYKVSDKGAKHYEIKKGQISQTLSYDKDRTTNTDMYFASLSQKDKDFYNAVFNKKIPNDAVDENGKRIGPSHYLKYNIQNQAKHDIKIANEKDGIEAFIKCMENSKDFSNYILDKERFNDNFDQRRSNFPGFKESFKALNNVRNNPDHITSDDAAKIYRWFNFACVQDDADTIRQRARFFKELKNEGYGAVLDVNDAIYGRFKAESPVMVFDSDAMKIVSQDRVTDMQKAMSVVRSVTNPAMIDRVLGLNK